VDTIGDVFKLWTSLMGFLSLMDPTSKSLQNHGQKVMWEKIVFLATILTRKLWKDAIKYHGQIDNFLGGHENLTGKNWTFVHVSQ
jgi:hypothetical protein